MAARPIARRRRALSGGSICLFLAGSLALGVVAVRHAPAAGPPSAAPNIIVVMTDDQGPYMMRALPAVQRRLAARGTTFTRAFASYPLCCPSRATLITGQYAHNHGVKGNNRRDGGGYRALSDPERNLAAWLQAAGYETAFVGKWLNGLRRPRHAPPGWDRWHGLVGEGGEGLSSFYDYEVFEPDDEPRHFGAAPRDYQTDALTREYVLPLISEQAVTPGPFFLWVAYHPPHGGLGRDDVAGRRCSLGPPDERPAESAIPAPRHATRFARASVPHPPSFDEADVSDKPAFIRRREHLDRVARERIARDHRCGLAALLSVDDAVARIVAALRDTDQLADTVIVFTTDHGVLGGQHRIVAGKNRPYEEAIGVPLIVRGPGVAAGATVGDPVANVDLAPTILALAAATAAPELARPLDGVSLLPALGGTDPGLGDRAVLLEGSNGVEPSRHAYKVRSYAGVRTRRYAYVEHRRASVSSIRDGTALPIGAGRTTDVELYDLRRDPFELRSRHRDPAYADVREALFEALAELEDCSALSCQGDPAVPPPSR